MSRFQPGHSGNPKGRPPKARALSALLSSQGELPTTEGGITHQAKLAQNLWQLLSFGIVQLENGPIAFTNARDWLEAARFVMTHIDGPAPAQLPEGQLEVIVTRHTVFCDPSPLHDDEA